MTARIEIGGQKFGLWTVLHHAGGGMWACQCVCGSRKNIASAALRKGTSRGCRRCRCGHGVHYGSGTRLYNIWAKMIARCSNSNLPEFSFYGGRGITVCKPWRSSFEAFQTWALANGYADNLTLDRRDNDGGYSAENCRWVTSLVQSRNRRSNRLIAWRGHRLTVAEVADQTGLRASTIYKRLSMGWSPEKATLTPVRR